MSAVYELNYRVLKYVSRPSFASEQHFYGFYHYQGAPAYTEYSPAILVLKSVRGSKILESIAPAMKFGAEWKYCEQDNEFGQCIAWQSVEDYAAAN
ncbi:hypothetical protein FHR99_000130 [Litorivivens lipolytica]|uniref:Uncharacterized protein n=1 Tax=Litorivivens lipolytica TaxID=1524264 RepID=A0A7W4W1X8_9GAMM|nr:hypothetical protein [Litorivivens lipolytica]MBB3045894.1 hypothetical protein [Litorivivens lipolytica]